MLAEPPVDPSLLGHERRRARARSARRASSPAARPVARASSSAPPAPRGRAASTSRRLRAEPGSRTRPAAAIPKLSSTSSAHVSGVAPSRSSAFEPADSAARDLARHGEHLPPLLEREVGRDQRAAPLARLDDDRRRTEAGDDPVARRKAPRRRLDARARTRRRPAPRRRPARASSRVRGRIVAVDAAAEHGDGHPARLERAAVRLAVDAAGEAADDDEARRGQLPAEQPRDLAAVRRAGAGADDRDRRPASSSRSALPAEEEPRRRVVDRAQQRREVGVGAADEAEAGAREALELGTRRRSAAWKAAKRALRGSSTTCASFAAANDASASSLMPRAPSASGRRAPRRRARAARRPRRRAPRPSAPRARPAPGRARRAAGARPRGRAARRPRSSARAAGPASRRAPAATRSRTGADGSAGPRRELLRPRPRNRHDEVEAVEERARELVAERREPLRRARALGRRVAAAGARTEVHRRDELEARREERLALHPCDRDDAVLERLPQRLERGPLELGQLVEQQDAAMGEARLARPRPGAAADDRRRRGAVMRRAERPARRAAAARAGGRPRPSGCASPRAPRAARAAAGSRASAGRASSSRFPAARRGAGCGRPRPRARAHAARAPGRARRRGRADRGSGLLVGRLCRRRPQLAAEVRDRLGEVAHRHRLDPAELRLAGRLGSAQNPLEPGAPRALGDGERAAHRPDPAVERQLADGRVLARAARPEAGATPPAPRARSTRSKPDPSFRRPAGARLTVIRFSGHSSCAEPIPLRTRCFASAHARSASPTIAKPGRPPSMCASTSTRRGSMPTSA